jgi:hypothetical protein
MSTPKQRKSHIKRPPQAPDVSPSRPGPPPRLAQIPCPPGCLQEQPGDSNSIRNQLAGLQFRSRQRGGRPTDSSSLSSPAPRRSRHRRDPSGLRGHAAGHNRQSARRQEFHRSALTSARFGDTHQMSGPPPVGGCSLSVTGTVGQARAFPARSPTVRSALPAGAATPGADVSAEASPLTASPPDPGRQFRRPARRRLLTPGDVWPLTPSLSCLTQSGPGATP